MGLKTTLRRTRHQLMTMLNDPEGRNLTVADIEKACQLDSGRTLQDDRAVETAEALNMDVEAVLALYKEFHVDKTRQIQTGTLDTSTDASLFDFYRDVFTPYVTKKMLGYTRFESATRLIKHLNAFYPPVKRPETRVLDYGCGVADYALAFARQGYFPVLSDLEGQPLDFARWRFERRGLPVDVIPVRADAQYPDLGHVHIVLAGEVLEHVRDPLRMVQNAERALPKGGFFWSSGFPDDERTVGDLHLQEAADKREETLDFLRTHFVKTKDVRHLYRKR